MVYLAITSSGLADALRSASADDEIWCGCEAITEAEYSTMKRPKLSRFIYPIADRHAIADAIGTIAEHHPGQTVWIEANELFNVALNGR